MVMVRENVLALTDRVLPGIKTPKEKKNRIFLLFFFFLLCMMKCIAFIYI